MGCSCSSAAATVPRGAPHSFDRGPKGLALPASGPPTPGGSPPSAASAALHAARGRPASAPAHPVMLSLASAGAAPMYDAGELEKLDERRAVTSDGGYRGLRRELQRLQQAAPSAATSDGRGDGLWEAAAEAEFEYEEEEYDEAYMAALLQQEFLDCAAQLSEDELREFVEDHVSGQLSSIKALPPEQRGQAFRSLCAEWHPDKCPAITGLATDIFQRLQAQKSSVLHSP